jgi:hypothetical protein
LDKCPEANGDPNQQVTPHCVEQREACEDYSYAVFMLQAEMSLQDFTDPRDVLASLHPSRFANNPDNAILSLMNALGRDASLTLISNIMAWNKEHASRSARLDRLMIRHHCIVGGVLDFLGTTP